MAVMQSAPLFVWRALGIEKSRPNKWTFPWFNTQTALAQWFLYSSVNRGDLPGRTSFHESVLKTALIWKLMAAVLGALFRVSTSLTGFWYLVLLSMQLIHWDTESRFCWKRWKNTPVKRARGSSPVWGLGRDGLQRWMNGWFNGRTEK